jgi:hypothetical protein
MIYKLIVPPEFYLKCSIPFCNTHADLYRHKPDPGQTMTSSEFLCNLHAIKSGFCVSCGLWSENIRDSEHITQCYSCFDEASSQLAYEEEK